MQVVDHEDEGTCCGEAAERDRHGVVGGPALEVAIGREDGRTRQHRCEVGHEGDPGGLVVADRRGQLVALEPGEGRSQGVDERLQEQRALGGMAPSSQDLTARGGDELGDRVDEPGLADAALADHEQQLCPAPGDHGLPRRVEHGELRRAAHQQDLRGVAARARQDRDAVGVGHRLAEQRELQVGRDPVRVGAEVLAQRPGELVVRRQGGGHPAVGGQRAHQVAHRALVVGVR